MEVKGLFNEGIEIEIKLLVLHMYNKRKICCVLGNLVILNKASVEFEFLKQ